MSKQGRPPAFYEGLADAYNTAVNERRGVTEAVRQYLTDYGVNANQPHVWIHEARVLGYLPPTRQGLSPGHHKRCEAVADALGIDPEKLRWAVIEFAEGRLFFR